MSEQRPNLPVPDPTLLTTSALQREIGHLRELMESQINQLRDLHDVKFADIANQLSERDRRYVESFQARDNAVAAALAAAKEAVGKSELATEKQIARILELITTSNEAHTEQMSLVKDRLGLVEGVHAGSMGQQGRQAQERTMVLAIIVAIAVVAGTVVSIVVATR